jgi:hypothetical protein
LPGDADKRRVKIPLGSLYLVVRASELILIFNFFLVYLLSGVIGGSYSEKGSWTF